MKLTKTLTDNPWSVLDPPGAMDVLTARRIDISSAWNFFWARDLDGRALLLLKYSGDSASLPRAPKLRGLSIKTTIGSSEIERLLIIQLEDQGKLDLFYRFCVDIIASTSSAMSESAAVNAAISRTWRWHHLLRGGPDGRLSIEEQKGLIGELRAIELYLLPRLSAYASINSWKGPLGTPKDFEIGLTCLEVKARRGAAAPYVKISSESQLDDNGCDALFLSIVELTEAQPDVESFTLFDLASNIRAKLDAEDPGATIIYDNLLAANGFSWGDDYSEFKWVEGNTDLYRVQEGFPRIVPSNLSHGVRRVTYSIWLVECEFYKVALDEFFEKIGTANVT